MGVDEIIENVWVIALVILYAVSLLVSVVYAIADEAIAEEPRIGTMIRRGLSEGASSLIDSLVPMFVPVALLVTNVFGAGPALDRLGPILRLSLAVCLLGLTFLVASRGRLWLQRAFGLERGPFAAKWFGVCASAYVAIRGAVGSDTGPICAGVYGLVLVFRTILRGSRD